MENVIKRKREEKKITQNELARRSGVNQSVISDIESGKTKYPRIDTLRALAGVLEFDWTEFFTEDGEAGA